MIFFCSLLKDLKSQFRYISSFYIVYYPWIFLVIWGYFRVRQNIWQQKRHPLLGRWWGEISEELNAVVVNMDEWCSGDLSSAAGISSLLLLFTKASVMLKTLMLLLQCYKGNKYAVEVGGFFCWGNHQMQQMSSSAKHSSCITNE